MAFIGVNGSMKCRVDRTSRVYDSRLEGVIPLIYRHPIGVICNLSVITRQR